MNKILKNKKSGFTLVELIVSLGLFTVVMMISTSALLSLADTNKKVQSMRIAFDNLNLALESMSREIRMGSVYTCNPSLPVILVPGTAGSNCTGGNSTVAFFPQNGDTMVYRLNGSIVQRSKDGGSNFSDITSSNVIINELMFYVRGALLTSGNQPHLTISLDGTAGSRVSSKFRIQTTITQRAPKK